MQKSIKKYAIAEEYVNNYAEELYEIDTLYRHILSDYKKIDDLSNEFEQLINEIELTYEKEFLSVLGNHFFECT